MTSQRVVYVDPSALGALLIEQSESDAVLRWLDRSSDILVSSDLLETELDGVALAALDRAVYRSAGLLPMPYLRTLDAIHLEAALRLDAAAILTYDCRLSDAARSLGLQVIAPGVTRE